MPGRVTYEPVLVLLQLLGLKVENWQKLSCVNIMLQLISLRCSAIWMLTLFSHYQMVTIQKISTEPDHLVKLSITSDDATINAAEDVNNEEDLDI